MRPAMSVMMTADVPPTEAADAGLDVRLHVPDTTRARASRPRLTVDRGRRRDRRARSTDLTRSHEAWMHLIATRHDLGTFAHVHPEPTGRPGELPVEMTFPTAGPVHREHRVPAAGRDGRRAPAAAGHHRRAAPRRR